MATSPQIQQLTQRQRTEIMAADEANLQRLAKEYIQIYDSLGGDIDALTKTIEQLDNPTRKEIEALPEYKRFIRHMNTELDYFTKFTEKTIEGASLAAIELGLAHSAEWIDIVATGFVGLDARAMIPLLDYLKRDGPLYDRLALLTGSTVDSVVSAIL